MTTATQIEHHLIAPDAVWIATAQLHSKQPEAVGFTLQEIQNEVNQYHLFSKNPKTIHQHISQHLVATKAANAKPRRMLTELPNHLFRLYVEGDDFHTSRMNSPTKPEADDLPVDLRHWLGWYSAWSKAHPSRRSFAPAVDPIEALEGTWTFGDGDTYLREMREGWEGRP